MNTIRKKRLAIVLGILIGVSVSVGLALTALSENINLFYTPTQIKKGDAPVNKSIRAGGMVVKGSINRYNSEDLAVSFMVTDYNDNLLVKYKGILPDLFREEQGIVVLGQVNEEGDLIAEQVLAKHDENYMPPEISDALKKSQ